MARLNDKQREMILSDFHIGKSQNELAKKYDVSPATINKLCKGLVPKYKDKVNEVVALKSQLSRESEYQSECFDKEVNDKLRRANLVYGNAEKALGKLNTMIDEVDNAMDLKTLIDANDRASLTLKVNERHAPKQDINLTNAQQNQPTQITIIRDE